MKRLRQWWQRRRPRVVAPVAPQPRFATPEVLDDATRTLGGCGATIETADGQGVCYDERGHDGPHRFVQGLE